MFGSPVLDIIGVYYAGASIASMVAPTTAVCTVVIAAVLGIEKPPSLTTRHGCAKILGVLSAVGGAVIILGCRMNRLVENAETPLSKNKSLLGVICLLVNTMCMSGYILIQKRYIFEAEASRWSTLPVSVTTWSYFFGAVCVAVVAGYYHVKCEPSAENQCDLHLPGQAIIAVLYSIFISSVFCYRRHAVS